jgi:RNA polymerase sigma factor (sigma-70 family)
LINKKKIKRLTDEQLILLYKNSGNQKCVGELFERYSHLLYGVCLKYLQQPDDAKDMLMVIYEKLLVDLKKYDIQVIKSWLYQASKNNCLMKLHKKKKEYFTDFTKYEVADNGTVLSDKKIKEIEITNLEEAILLLIPNQQICINLFYIKKKSYQQVLEETSFSLKEVKSNIQNGKRNLKILIEQMSPNNKKEDEFI